MYKLLIGDVREKLLEIPDGSIQTCVTSPPYFGLRDYGTARWSGGSEDCDHALPMDAPNSKKMTSGQQTSHAGRFANKPCRKCGAVRIDNQIGLERTPEGYVETMVSVFREVRRTLKDDGTLWLNLGDSYWGGKGKSGQAWSTAHTDRETLQKPHHQITGMGETRPQDGKHATIKPKDLVGIPWMVAFALRVDGWYLRSDIIWHKPNPMPESVTDRPTRAHEYIFLMSKSARYYYDADAIKEPITDSSVEILGQDVENQEGSERANGGAKTNGPMKAVRFGGNKAAGYGTRRASGKEWNPKQGGGGNGFKGHSGNKLADGTEYIMRNKRSVWSVTTKGFSGAHFSTFPIDLIEPCIRAGSKEGDTVLDPFAGSGTTLEVAERLGRDSIGIELSEKYAKELIEPRMKLINPLFQLGG